MRGTSQPVAGLLLLALLVAVMAPVASEGQAAKPPAQRRDPFRSLLAAPGGGGGPAECIAPGKAGLMVGQLSVVGIVVMPSDSVAVVNAPGRNRAYFLRERDELCDGYVSRITPDNVAFREKAKDAYGRAYEREVVKQITAAPGVRR